MRRLTRFVGVGAIKETETKLDSQNFRTASSIVACVVLFCLRSGPNWL